jgi:hypothetical protein
MAYWSGFYEKLFNFQEIRYFDIKGEYTGLTSQAMMAPDGVIRIPLNEESVKTGGHPAHDRAQRHSAWGDSGGCGLSGLPVFVGATTPSRMTLEQGNLLTRGRVSREGSVILRVLRLKLGENKTQIGLSLSKKFVKESADVLAEMKAMA